MGVDVVGWGAEKDPAYRVEAHLTFELDTRSRTIGGVIPIPVEAITADKKMQWGELRLPVPSCEEQLLRGRLFEAAGRVLRELGFDGEVLRRWIRKVWPEEEKAMGGDLTVGEVPHGGNAIMRYFASKHQPPHLQVVSQMCADLAEEIDAVVPQGPEKSAGLRKLLEAKDCFVRAMLP